MKFFAFFVILFACKYRCSRAMDTIVMRRKSSLDVADEADNMLVSCPGLKYKSFFKWSPKILRAGLSYDLDVEVYPEKSFYSGKERFTGIMRGTSEVVYNDTRGVSCRELKDRFSQAKPNITERVNCPWNEGAFLMSGSYHIPEYLPLNAIVGSFRVSLQLTNDRGQVVYCLQGSVEVSANVEDEDEN